MMIEGIQGAGPLIFIWGAGFPQPRMAFFFVGRSNATAAGRARHPLRIGGGGAHRAFADGYPTIT